MPVIVAGGRHEYLEGDVTVVVSGNDKDDSRVPLDRHDEDSPSITWEQSKAAVVLAVAVAKVDGTIADVGKAGGLLSSCRRSPRVLWGEWNKPMGCIRVKLMPTDVYKELRQDLKPIFKDAERRRKVIAAIPGALRYLRGRQLKLGKA